MNDNAVMVMLTPREIEATIHALQEAYWMQREAYEQACDLSHHIDSDTVQINLELAQMRLQGTQQAMAALAATLTPVDRSS